MIIRVPLAPSAPMPMDMNRKSTIKRELTYIPRSQRSQQDEQNEAALKRQDPFLFYSDDRRRMEYLLDREDQRDTTAITEDEEVPSTRLIERKTCISFEVSDTLAMESVFEEMAAPEVCNSNNLDLVLKNMLGGLSIEDLTSSLLTMDDNDEDGPIEAAALFRSPIAAASAATREAIASQQGNPQAAHSCSSPSLSIADEHNGKKESNNSVPKKRQGRRRSGASRRLSGRGGRFHFGRSTR